MAKMIDKKPTYNGEAKVWERLNEYLPNDIVVYNQREINGREYDFCLMIENVGMLIIEVKGWKADKICVNGVDEIEVEGYDKIQISPKKQARAYRFALLNKISEKYNVSPLVLDMVCYPFISKEEYLEKHLNIISEEAYTIFSEDLDDGDLLNKKINTVFEKNNLIPHSDFTYDLMLRIRRNYEPDLMKKNEYADAITPYSKLFFLPSSVDASKCKEVVDMYAAGVKTVVFVERRESFKSILSYLDYFLKKMNIGYKKNNLFVGSSEKMEKHYEDDIFRIFNFELYMYSALSRICETSFEIVEGKVTDDNKIILRKLSENTEFNLQQYEVEHATTEKNILVEAGAGTGKTFSMVSRVAFLCNKELDPVMNIADEIAMVTFTNDAAINMKKRLKDNHKDRITKYVYIPSDVLDEAGIYEFVAKYVNTMSLSDDTISDWVNGHANPEDYPIHDVVEGRNWEYVQIGHNKNINIYPFTKRSIMYFYNNVLQKGHQTPRYIIRDIIEPVVRDAIYNKENFPSLDIDIVNHNQTLTFRIHNQIDDQELGNRLYKFMSIWGNGKPEQYEEEGVVYISTIRKEIYEDFGFPILKMDAVTPNQERNLSLDGTLFFSSVFAFSYSRRIACSRKFSALPFTVCPNRR